MTQPQNAERQVVAMPGLGSLGLSTVEQAFLAPAVQGISLLSRLALSHGEGTILTDVDGNPHRTRQQEAETCLQPVLLGYRSAAHHAQGLSGT